MCQTGNDGNEFLRLVWTRCQGFEIHAPKILHVDSKDAAQSLIGEPLLQCIPPVLRCESSLRFYVSVNSINSIGLFIFGHWSGHNFQPGLPCKVPKLWSLIILSIL